MTAYRTVTLMIGLGTAVVSMCQTTTADAYFNQASKEYVKQDKMQALRTIDHGLKQYPGDPKLLKLAEELVKEEEKKQQQDQQQQQKEEQEKKEQEKKGQEKKDQEQAQEKKEQEQEQAQDQKEQQRKDQEKKQDEQAQRGDPKDQKGQPSKAGMIAPQDAMRMLDALERSEKDVQEKVRAKRRPASRRTIEKDW